MLPANTAHEEAVPLIPAPNGTAPKFTSGRPSDPWFVRSDRLHNPMGADSPSDCEVGAGELPAGADLPRDPDVQDWRGREGERPGSAAATTAAEHRVELVREGFDVAGDVGGVGQLGVRQSEIRRGLHGVTLPMQRTKSLVASRYAGRPGVSTTPASIGTRNVCPRSRTLQ